MLKIIVPVIGVILAISLILFFTLRTPEEVLEPTTVDRPLPKPVVFDLKSGGGTVQQFYITGKVRNDGDDGRVVIRGMMPPPDHSPIIRSETVHLVHGEVREFTLLFGIKKTVELDKCTVTATPENK